MSSPSTIDASPLTLDKAAQEIRQTQDVPFDADDLLAQHGIQLSCSLQSKWPSKSQVYTVPEAMNNLQKGSNDDKEMLEQARVCVRAYLEAAKNTPDWITQTSENILQIEKARDALREVINSIEKSTPLQ